MEPKTGWSRENIHQSSDSQRLYPFLPFRDMVFLESTGSFDVVPACSETNATKLFFDCLLNLNYYASGYFAVNTIDESALHYSPISCAT